MDNLILVGKHVLVVGLGISGKSAAQFLLQQGAIVYGVDRNLDQLNTDREMQILRQAGLQVYLEQDFKQFSLLDLMVISPGVSETNQLVVTAKQAAIPIVGEMTLGCHYSTNRMVGITGTNGKTTVTLLITHVLSQCGYVASALGNVGTPLTSKIMSSNPEEIFILELSSYQLETLFHPCLDQALLLNITPDHLDRYTSMEAYAKAKCNLKNSIKKGGHFYIEERAWDNFGYLLDEKTSHLYGYRNTSFIYTDLNSVYRAGKKVLDLPETLRNKKSHDLENFLSAFAICVDYDISSHLFLDAWFSFKKPSHRIEFITEIKGVKYYDDSKGTNIDAVIRAVESLDGSIILIVGGVDKCFPYTPWLKGFRNKVKSICAIGQAAGKIYEQLISHIPVMIFNSLDEAVKEAAKMAKKGDSVLLSPGCSSYDMFKDYVHRGKEFQRIVQELRSKDDQERYHSHCCRN